MRDVPTVFLILTDLDRAGKTMAETLERNDPFSGGDAGQEAQAPDARSDVRSASA